MARAALEQIRVSGLVKGRGTGPCLSPAVPGGARTAGTGASEPRQSKQIKGFIVMFENDNKVHILDHPLLQHKLSILRDERTGVKEFREIVSRSPPWSAMRPPGIWATQEVEIKTPWRPGPFGCWPGRSWPSFPSSATRHGGRDPGPDPSARWDISACSRDPETHQPVDYYSADAL